MRAALLLVGALGALAGSRSARAEGVVLGAGGTASLGAQAWLPDPQGRAADPVPVALRSLRLLAGVELDGAPSQLVVLRHSPSLLGPVRPGSEGGLWLRGESIGPSSGPVTDLGGQFDAPALERGAVGLGLFGELGASSMLVGDSAVRAYSDDRRRSYGLFGGAGLAGRLAVGDDLGLALVVQAGAVYRHLWLGPTTLRMVDPLASVDLRLRL